MEDDNVGWLTYQEAGDRMGVSPRGRAGEVRSQALAQANRRRRAARISLPEDERPPGDRPITGRSLPERENERTPDDPPVIARSLAGHRAINRALATTLESHIKTLQGELEASKEQLATERAAFAADKTALAGDLAAERARADQTIAAFAALADKLEAIAAGGRPWWRRLVG
ncbi:MAG TPA: hypothetical protein VGG77_16700 [Roseiarcus sp.]|jgi:hypothetical protein